MHPHPAYTPIEHNRRLIRCVLRVILRYCTATVSGVNLNRGPATEIGSSLARRDGEFKTPRNAFLIYEV